MTDEVFNTLCEIAKLWTRALRLKSEGCHPLREYRQIERLQDRPHHAKRFRQVPEIHRTKEDR